ncbi:PTS ascorbate transporter subunit IIC [Clostridium oceanicum]|uniref:Ascorbate-specific PTS system EIIC component n=1 Tax=Clostridium oceanicum TaxID=1543 RepID=A0ABN1J969_9CLOT
MTVLNWIATNMFGQPSILIGLVVFVGLALQKKNLSNIIQGSFKSIMGFLIIGIGSGVIVESLVLFEPMWAEVFGLKTQTFANFMGQEGFIAKYGSVVTMAMTIGFLINLLLARFTKMKYIYLTGHMMFWTTLILAGVIIHTNPNVSNTFLLTFLSIFMGIYWTVQPALVQPLLRKITNMDSIALGHTSASVAIIGSFAGKLLGNEKKNAEELKVSPKWAFIRDSNIVTGLTMATLFIVGAILLSLKNTGAANEILAKSGDTNFYVHSIIMSLKFAGGIAIVLFGVRMFIGELVPAFKGIATKLVPNAKPALDCPIVFTYAPNSVILGFLGSFIGAIFWLLILGKFVGYVFVPTMIVLFFHSATAGVFGNKTGGVRGALIAGFLTSTVVAVGQYLMITFFLTSTIPDTAMWAADSDMFILAPIVRFITSLFM